MAWQKATSLPPGTTAITSADGKSVTIIKWGPGATIEKQIAVVNVDDGA